MIVDQLVPRVGEVAVDELLQGLRAAPRRHASPFNALRIEFSDAVSRALFRHPRSRSAPEILAAAFWLRRAAVSRLASRFAELESTGSIRAPRGLAFHVPPANVDTLFVYSLMTSFLVGNLDLVRVSRSRSDQTEVLCEVLRAVLAEDRFAELRDELAIVSYGHESAPTTAISIEADVRLLWGGDETIEHMRAFPVGPGTHDLTFGDRFSFAALRPEAILQADDEARRAVTEQLYNDAYWFDQLGCASPRLIVWVGTAETVDEARRILFTELARVIADKGYALPAGAAIAKLTYIYGALIDRPVDHVHRPGNELSVLRLEHLDGFDRTHPGGGLFFEARVNALSDLVAFVRRKDQTLTVHGFSPEELSNFARSLHGRGIDRIVEFGEALSFSSLWDGYDLLAELTRTIAVPSPART